MIDLRRDVLLRKSRRHHSLTDWNERKISYANIDKQINFSDRKKQWKLLLQTFTCFRQKSLLQSANAYQCCLLTIKIIHVKELRLLWKLTVNGLLQTAIIHKLIISIIISIITLITCKAANNNCHHVQLHVSHVCFALPPSMSLKIDDTCWNWRCFLEISLANLSLCVSFFKINNLSIIINHMNIWKNFTFTWAALETFLLYFYFATCGRQAISFFV